MPTQTYELLASVDLTSTSATIELTNIPQTSTHLFLTIMPNIANDRPYIRFNDITSSNYNWKWFTGSDTGTLGTSTFSQGQIQGAENNLSNYRGGHQLRITNYSNSKHKGFYYMGQAGDNKRAWAAGGNFNLGQAITKITIASASASYGNGTKVSLWGVLI